MRALQLRLPSPMAIPKNTYKIILDLKDCFYTIPLDPVDCKRFAFSVPSVNLKEPMKRYHWLVLPQGMANSPTLCQKFVASALAKTREKYPEVYTVHYMDDILIAHTQEGVLLAAYAELQQGLTAKGLVIAPEKVQRQAPYEYLGYHLEPHYFSPQKLELRKDNLKTLNDFQRLLGDIHWIRPHFKNTTGELKPLFDILKGNADPTSEPHLTPEGRAVLAKIEEALGQQKTPYFDYHATWEASILPTRHTPMRSFIRRLPCCGCTCLCLQPGFSCPTMTP